MPTAPAPDRPFGPRFVVPVLVGPVLNPINTTMISVALVPISHDLGIPTSRAVWLVAGLYLASAVAQPVMGRLADVLGPRRVYLAGLVTVLVAGVLPLVWPGFAGVLAARVLIGLGTSSAYPSAMTLISDRSRLVGRPTPPALLSGLSIAGLTTAAVGPVLGGLLIALFEWQAIFLVNVPLALAALAMTLAWIPRDRDRPRAEGVATERPGIDVVGIALFGAGLTALLVFLLELAHPLWPLLGVAVLLLAGFVAWELRRTAPFVDVRMLATNGALTRTYARMFLVYVAAYSVVYGYSQWLQGPAGFDADAAGLLQLPTAVLAGLASVAVARAVRLRAPLVAAGGLAVVGGLLLTGIAADAPLWLLLVVAAVFGVPQGLASVANQAALYRQAPAAQIGTASGLSRTAVYLAAIASSAVIGLVFDEAPTDAGLHVIGWVVLAAGAAATVLAAVDRALAGTEGRRREG
ncbi:MFS transporter [Cellulomonas triticagri]|uniref:MFS transporter n=1 Tax=Cellulomonas triticagri TaxID=2483352 RepID=A0A3M2JLT5_9CELL|nr:MFS transporter [Cellulomonas triticagri]RMI12553.1 MFS transporter [Cellulomonas triticagri]